MKSIVLFIISALIAIYLGFSAFTSQEMYLLYGNLSYYFISIIFFIWLYFVYIALKQVKSNIIPFLSFHKIAIVLSFILVILFFYICPPEFRILADETNLLGTSKALYEHRDSVMSTEELEVSGNKQIIKTYIDKRFLLFPYFLHIIHYIKSYSPNNAFILNALFSFVCLFLIYYLFQQLWGKFYGIIALLFLASYPLFIQYSMSAGYDVFCLTWVLFAFVVFCNYFRNNTVQNANLLLYTVALLSYTRYECSIMAIIIVPIMLAILGKNNINKLGYEFIIYPLLFIPTAWIMFFVNTNSYLQIDGNGNAFSIYYLKDNILKALYFFSGWDYDQDTVFIIALMACLGVLFVIYKILVYKKLFIEKLKLYKYHLILIFFFLLDQTLIKFAYKYGDLTLNLNSRFGITLLPYIIFFSIFFTRNLIKKHALFKIAILLIVFYTFFSHWPKTQQNFIIKSNNSYKIFKAYNDFLNEQYKNTNKEKYILALDRPIYLAPLNYNVISINTLNQNFDLIKNSITQKKLWNELILIQTIDNGEIRAGSILKEEINIKTIYEKAIDEKLSIRFSKLM